jgi:phage terminase large subunit
MIKEPGVYLHCFPKYNQAKRAIWKGVHDTDYGEPMAYLDHFPQELVKSKNGSEMSIELVNGSVYHLMGMDGKSASVARGMNPKFVILSEYAFMERSAWDVIEPRVSQNNGTAIFLSTPNGQNHFYDLYNYASSPKGKERGYFASLLTIDNTLLHDSSFIENKRSEGMPEDFIQQEYYCSFTMGAQGSYYGKLIQQARDEDRLTNLTIHSDLPCHTAWDIGIGDSTAIFIFQCLPNGKINVLHYYENNNEGLDHYLRYIDRWKEKAKAIWGTHYVPHDMQNREFTTGVDRLTTARQMGYNMQIVPRKPIDEGIQAVRSLLPHCSFNFAQCEKGIKCLDFYRKKYNEGLKVYYDEPLHDQYSHGADAFRMLAIGVKALGSSQGRIAPSQTSEWSRKHRGY